MTFPYSSFLDDMPKLTQSKTTTDLVSLSEVALILLTPTKQLIVECLFWYHCVGLFPADLIERWQRFEGLCVKWQKIVDRCLQHTLTGEMRTHFKQLKMGINHIQATLLSLKLSIFEIDRVEPIHELENEC